MPIQKHSLAVNTALDAISESVEAIVDSVTGVTGDIVELKRIIDQLQSTSGVLTPEDQALLDAIQSKANSLVARMETLKVSVAELDAQNAATPPPVVIPPTNPA